MPNLIKKSWTVSNLAATDQLTIPLVKLPCSLPVMSHGIPEEYSQNPDHIHKISGHTLWYKDLKKLKGKSKMVEGDLAKYR